MIPECLRCGTPLQPNWIRFPVCIGEQAAVPISPVSNENRDCITPVAWEMTLRDWFAGMALNAMLTEGFQPNFLRENHYNTADFNYFRAAYQAADEMLKRRQQPKG